MRMLVAGRSGQVARELVERAPPGVAVTAWGRETIDLAQPDGLAGQIARLRPDVVVNAAAWTAVDLAETEEAAAHAVNATGAGALAAAAAAAGAPLVQLSTDYVFGGRKTAPYVETDPVGPLGAYGRSKLAGERAVAAAQPRSAILRTAWVYAAHGRNFVRTMLQLAAGGGPLRIVADQVGDPTSAADVADAAHALAARLVRPDAGAADFGIFHFSSQAGIAWADFAEAIFATAGDRLPALPAVERIATADRPTPAPRPLNSRLDSGRIAAVHAIACRPWRTGLAEVLDRLLGPAGGAR